MLIFDIFEPWLLYYALSNCAGNKRTIFNRLDGNVVIATMLIIITNARTTLLLAINARIYRIYL